MAKSHRKTHKQNIIDLAIKGMNLTNIAKELKINRLDVKIVLEENGLYKRKRKFNKDKPELQKQAIQLYSEGYSLREIEEKIDIPRQAVGDILRENNIELRKAGNYNKKYILNDFSFSEYTPESVYWAGFIAGDGCIYSHGLGEGNDENNYLSIGLEISDEKHLLKFKEFIQYDGVLYYKKNGKAVSITVNSRQIVSDLFNKYGITNNKTDCYTPPNNMPNEYIKYFILGLIDSDGSISRSLRPNRNPSVRLRGEYIYQMNFTGTSESCEFVKRFFGSKVKLTARRKERGNNNFTIVFQGNEQILKYGEMIYDEKSIEFCLRRKYEIFCALKEEYK